MPLTFSKNTVCHTGQASDSGGVQQGCAELEGCGGGGGLGGPAPLQTASAHRARAQAGVSCLYLVVKALSVVDGLQHGLHTLLSISK